MNRLYYIVFSLFFLFTGFILKSQEADSLNAINSRYDSILKTESLGLERMLYKHEKDLLINNLGPFGSRYYFIYSGFLFENEINKGDDELLIKLKKLRGIKPFTNITYINASRKEQIFKIKHVQGFGKQLSFSFDLDKVSSPGAYINQEANNGYFGTNLNFQSKKNNYQISFSNEIQRDFYQENGGIKNSVDFENNLYDDEQNYSVNLLTSNSFIKRYKYTLSQRLDLFKLGNDSLSYNKIYLSHLVSYETKSRVFYDNDPSSKIYNKIYLDSAKIMSLLSLDSLVNSTDSINYYNLSSISRKSSIDSSFNRTISNTLGVGFRSQYTKIEFLYQYDIKNYYQGFELDTISRYVDTSYVNTYAGIRGNFKGKYFEGAGIFKYGVSGYRSGDILSEIHISSNSKKHNIAIGAGYFLTEPDLKYVNYLSNHFLWNNNFNKQSVVSFKGKIMLNKFQLELIGETKIVSNALYYDTLSLAAQVDKSISISSFTLAKDYKWWRFYFRTAGIYQVTSDRYIAPLPQLTARQIMYYESRAFKKALKIQIGIGASYSTDYYGYAYSPAISEFYVQQSQKLGNYPNIDIFLNTYLKRAQIFLKWEHFNSGRSNYKSYLAPDYPQLPRSLKFGVSWNLFD